ncbi:MAG TPA: hypothetical protein VHE30_04595 [Polyangiaceae bacterium]|nr:hypothetical protein [Polyangiaceae bacterium]
MNTGFGSLLLAVGLSASLVACGSDSSTSSGTPGSGGGPSGGGSNGGGGSTGGGGAAGGPASGGGSSTDGGAGSGGADPGSGDAGDVGTWFCVDVGKACSCVQNPGSPGDTCTTPKAPCCFTFGSGCQCQPTDETSCPQWLSAVNGTQVSTCPPP